MGRDRSLCFAPLFVPLSVPTGAHPPHAQPHFCPRRLLLTPPPPLHLFRSPICSKTHTPPPDAIHALPDNPDPSSDRRRALTASRLPATVCDERDGEPLLHVVFVHPQIHWNTGNIGRTCLGLGARLHLVGPLGFSLDARQIRRAGLDYWHHVDVCVYEDWSHFAIGEMQRIGGTRYFFTKFGDQCITQTDWARDQKLVLIFGSEVNGFDGIRHWLDTDGRDEKLVAFPMVDDRFRSFNLSTTASMALWDAYKTIQQREHPTIKP